MKQVDELNGHKAMGPQASGLQLCHLWLGALGQRAADSGSLG